MIRYRSEAQRLLSHRHCGKRNCTKISPATEDTEVTEGKGNGQVMGTRSWVMGKSSQAHKPKRHSCRRGHRERMKSHPPFQGGKSSRSCTSGERAGEDLFRVGELQGFHLRSDRTIYCLFSVTSVAKISLFLQLFYVVGLIIETSFRIISPAPARPQAAVSSERW